MPVPPREGRRSAPEVLKRRLFVEEMLSRGLRRTEIIARLKTLTLPSKDKNERVHPPQLARVYPDRSVDRDIAAVKRKWAGLAEATLAETKAREVGRMVRLMSRGEIEGKYGVIAPLARLLYELLGLLGPRQVQLSGALGLGVQVQRPSVDELRGLLESVVAHGDTSTDDDG